jgi:hypothetical protein
MKTTHHFLRSGMALLSSITLVDSAALSAQTIPVHDHVIVVMMENYNYSNIIGDVTNCPYINSLATDSMGALFTKSFAIEHPSQPNYLDIFSGSNQGVTNDLVPSGTFSTANLRSELASKSATFCGYSESLTPTGSNTATSGGSGGYAHKHAPWANWMGASSNAIPTTEHKIYPSEFPTNYTSLPTVSFLVPNLVDDMHNGTSPTNKQAGDNWLKNNIKAYITWAKTHNSLLILQWDEDDNTGGTNQIVTIFIGQNVKKGNYTETINHYCILRTLEDMYGTGYAGASSTACSITDCWKVLTTGIATSKGGPTGSVSVMPNPFSSETLLKVDIEMHNAGLKLYNSLGQEVKHTEGINGFETTLSRNGLPAGIYYFSLIQDNMELSRGKVLIQ